MTEHRLERRRCPPGLKAPYKGPLHTLRDNGPWVINSNTLLCYRIRYLETGRFDDIPKI